MLKSSHSVVDVAAKVLFFGQDTRRSVPALRRAGYSVRVCGSVSQIHPSMAEDAVADAIGMSGEWEIFLDHAISIARDRTRIPLILFASPGKPCERFLFDLVVPPSRPVSQWLSEIELLIRECQSTCAEARRVRATSDQIVVETRASIERSRLDRERARLERESAHIVREQSRLERERSGSLIGLNGRWDIEKVPGIGDFLAAPPVCLPCEERDRLNWSIMMAVARMSNLLVQAAKVQLDNGGVEQIQALLGEEKSLAAGLEVLLGQWKAHRASHGC